MRKTQCTPVHDVASAFDMVEFCVRLEELIHACRGEGKVLETHQTVVTT
jgi:hypothetical protein